MKNILVHYNSAEELNSVIDAALTLNKAYKTDITFAHVAEKAGQKDIDLQNQIQSLIKDRVSPGSNIKFVNKEGKPYQEIPEIAKDHHIIIMKSEEEKGFHLFKSNSVYNAVVDSPCPVLTFKENGLKKIQSIVIPIDTSAESRQKIPKAIDIAKHFNATIHILAYGPENIGKEEKRKLELYADQADHFIKEKGVKSVVDIALGKNVIDMVIKYAEKNAVDMIIITVEEDASYFGSSAAEKLIINSPIPVLSIQPKDLKVSWAGL